MSSSIVKVQIPMEKSLRDALVELAADRGFDSVQAYVRFWATNAVKGRTVQFEENEPWPEPPTHVAERLDRELSKMKEEEARGKAKGYNSVTDFMKDL